MEMIVLQILLIWRHNLWFHQKNKNLKKTQKD